MKKVAIVMGSDSDLPIVKKAAQVLKDFGVPTELRVLSAHRCAAEVSEFARNAEKNGTGVIIAAAGKADTYDRRKHSDIGQPDGVVIKTYHRKNISNSCGILTITQPHHIMQALSTHFYQADTLCKRENG